MTAQEQVLRRIVPGDFITQFKLGSKRAIQIEIAQMLHAMPFPDEIEIVFRKRDA